MPGKRHSEEQILYALRRETTFHRRMHLSGEIDWRVLAIEGGKKVSEVCREMGVSQQAVYSRKRRYAGLGLHELRELRQLREENRKLKGIVADLTLDKHILQEVLSKKA
jgi:Transposase.